MQVQDKNIIGILPNHLPHETHLFGLINGGRFDLKGGGTGNPHTGLLKTSLDSVRGPVHFPMTILSPIALMGYPTYSNYQQGGTDLFKISDGYSYERNFKFDNGGFMHSHHDIKRSNGKLVGEFEVLNASLELPEAMVLDPTCIETFYPAGVGKIESFFKMRWLEPSKFNEEVNVILTADVWSTYTLKHTLRLPKNHFRMIKFDTEHTQSRLRQDEILSVFYDIEQLNELMVLAKEASIA